MELSIINILLAFNCGMAALLRGFKGLYTNAIGLATILIFMVYIALNQWQENLIMIVACGVGISCFLHELLKKENSTNPELNIFMGFIPLLLASSTNILSFFIYLFIFEVFKDLLFWRGSEIELKWLKRRQYLNSLKYLLICLSLFAGILVFGQIDFPSKVVPSKHALVVLALWSFLSFSYAGIFEGAKDTVRNINTAYKFNPCIFIAITQYFIPLSIIVKIKEFMMNMDFDLYQTGIQLTSTLALLTILFSIFKSGRKESRTNVYSHFIFLISSPLFLFVDSFTVTDYLCINLFSGMLSYGLVIFSFAPFQRTGRLLITPGPFSPIYIYILIETINYSGPQNAWIKSLSFLGFILIYNLILEQSSPLLSCNKLKDLAPVAGLALFVSILFVVRIAL